MSLSNKYENILIDHLFGGDTFTLPSSYRIGVFKNTAPYNEADVLIEPPSTAGYARVVVANDKTTFSSAAVGGSLTNNIEILFPTAIGAWGACTHIGLFEDAPSGDLVAYGEIAGGTPVTISTGIKLVFPIGSITISLD